MVAGQDTQGTGQGRTTTGWLVRSWRWITGRPDQRAGDAPVPVNEMLWAELSALGRRGENDPAPDLKSLYEQVGQWPDEKATSALCFSGGGIRSATFNLGVIQALARAGLLTSFDYLSSVSGGGYIAGWLQSWLKRSSMQAALAALADPTSVPNFRPLVPEPRPLDHLREYSNYLTPRAGLFSADTWTALAMIVRNLLLNWLVLLPAMAVVVAIPQAALIFAELYGHPDLEWGTFALALAVLAELLAAVGVYHFRRQSPPRSKESTVIRFAVLPIWAAALLMSLAGLWLQPEKHPLWLLLFCAIWCVAAPLGGWMLSLFTTGRNSLAPLWRSDAVGIVFSGVVATGLLFVAGYWLLPHLRPAAPRLFVIFAVPVLLGIYLFARALYVAFASIGEGRKRPDVDGISTATWADADREWWARLSGWMLVMIIGWMATSALIVFGHYLAEQVTTVTGRLAAGMGGLTGLIAALIGAAPGTPRDATDTESKLSPVKDIALRLLAPLTIACIIVALAEFNAWIGGLVTGVNHLFYARHMQALALDDEFSAWGVFWKFSVTMLIMGAASWGLGWVVNVNRFSAHGLYRNRLVRAYLGASRADRDKDTDPFTGFSMTDDIPLHELHRGRGMRLFPVVNVALNLTRSAEHLAWQQRKAESFSMTPLYCGNFFEGYRCSREYGGPTGLTLGTAITISGAAANPNAGYHSSPLVSFLMALFNVRLGCWLGNTNDYGHGTYRLRGPRHAWKPWFGDLFGLTDAERPYVNLSDGGHFENLGVYEMILRRCRFILASDAGQDPDFGFEDLGNLIRKVRIDFGIPIEFTHRIRILARNDKMPEGGLIGAIATIDYAKVDGNKDRGSPVKPGLLLYLKPTLRADGPPVPYDIYSYSRSSKLFPHESTADQWFNEAQFESYRALGDFLVTKLLDNWDNPDDVSQLFRAAPALFEKAENRFVQNGRAQEAAAREKAERGAEAQGQRHK